MFPRCMYCDQFKSCYHIIERKGYVFAIYWIFYLYMYLAIRNLVGNIFKDSSDAKKSSHWCTRSARSRKVFKITSPICLKIFWKLLRYIQSVTEEEVKNGILHNPNSPAQSLMIDREYTNLDKADSQARDFVDMAGTLDLFFI